MAVQSKGKAPQAEEKGKRPDMVLRARQSVDSDFYLTLGVAWEIEVNGQKAYSVKLQSVPVGWDGSCLMMPPKAEE